MIPNKSRKEWKELVTGRSPHNFANYVFQLKVNQAVQDIQNGTISVEEAVSELYELCEKYEKAVKPDLEKIFNI